MRTEIRRVSSLCTSARERRLWILAAAWLLTIYVTLPIVPLFLAFLRARNLLRLSLAALFASVAGVITARILRASPGRREVAVLSLSAAVYVVLLLGTSIVEEQIHYLQYGLLGALVYGALRERWYTAARDVPRQSRLLWQRWPGIAAATLTAACGWIDEGIQALLPNRVYDLRDVRLNAVAGVLAIGTIALRERARRADRKAIVSGAEAEPPTRGTMPGSDQDRRN